MADWFKEDGEVAQLKKKLSEKDNRCANLQGDLEKRNRDYEALNLLLKEANYKLQQEADRATKLDDQLAKKTTEFQRERLVRQNVESALDTANEKIRQEKKTLQLVQLELDNYALHSSGSSASLTRLTRERDDLQARVSKLESQSRPSPHDLETQIEVLKSENARLQQQASNYSAFSAIQTPTRARVLGRTPGRPRSSSTGDDVRIYRLEQELSELRTSHAKLESTAEETKKKLSKASTDLIAMENAKIAREKALQRTIEDLNSDLEDARYEIEGLKYELDGTGGAGTGADVQQLKRQLVELEARCQEKDGAIAQLESARALVTSQHAELSSKITTLEAQLGEARQAAIAASRQPLSLDASQSPALSRSTSDRSVRTLQRDLASALREKDALEVEVKELDEMVDSKDKEISSLRSQLALSSMSSHSSPSTESSSMIIHQVTQERDELRTRLEELSGELSASQDEVAALRCDIGSFEKELSTVHTHFENARQEARDLKVELEGVRNAPQGPSDADIHHLETLLAEKDSDITQLQEIIQSTSSDLAVLQSSKSHLEDELVSTKHSLRELSTASAELTELRQHLEEAQRHMESVEESRADAVAELVELRAGLEKKDSDLRAHSEDAATQVVMLQLQLSKTEENLISTAAKIHELEELREQADSALVVKDRRIAELEESLNNQPADPELCEQLFDLQARFQDLEDRVKILLKDQEEKTEVIRMLKLQIQDKENEEVHISATLAVPHPTNTLSTSDADLTLEDLIMTPPSAFSSTSSAAHSDITTNTTAPTTKASTPLIQHTEDRNPPPEPLYDSAAVTRILEAVDRLRTERDDLRKQLHFLQLEAKFAAAPDEPRREEAMLALQVELENHRRIQVEASQRENEQAFLIQRQKEEGERLYSRMVEVEEELNHTTQALKVSRLELRRLGLIATASLVTTLNLHNQLEDVTSTPNIQPNADDSGLQDRLDAITRETEERIALKDSLLRDAISQRDQLRQESVSLREKVVASMSLIEQLRSKENDVPARKSQSTNEAGSSLSSTADSTTRLRMENEELKARVGRREDQITRHQHDLKRGAMNLQLAEESVEEMRVELEELQNRLAECEDELACVKEDNETVRNQREADRKTLGVLEEERENLEDQLSKARSAVGQMETDLSSVQLQLGEKEESRSLELTAMVEVVFNLRSRSKALSRTLIKSEHANRQYQTELDEWNQRDTEMQEELRYTLVELDAARAELTTAVGDVQTLREQEVQLDKALSEARSNTTRLAEELSTKQTEHKQLLQDRDELAALLDELRTTQHSRLEGESNLKEQLAASKKLLSQKETQLQELEEAVERSSGERSVLMDELEEWKLKHGDISAQAETSRKEHEQTVAELKGRLEKMELASNSNSVELDELAKETGDLKDEISVLKSQLKNAEANHKQAQEDRQADSEKLENVAALLEEARVQNDMLVQELEELEAKVSASNEGLQELENSKQELEDLRKEVQWSMQERMTAVASANESAEKVDELERENNLIRRSLREAKAQVPSKELEEEVVTLKEKLALSDRELERLYKDLDGRDDKEFELHAQVKKLAKMNESLSRKLARATSSTSTSEAHSTTTNAPAPTYHATPVEPPQEPVQVPSEARRPLAPSTNLIGRTQEPTLPSSKPPQLGLGLRLPGARNLSRSTSSAAPQPNMALNRPIAVSTPLPAQQSPSTMQTNSRASPSMHATSPSLILIESPSVLKKRTRDDEDDLPASPLPAEPVMAHRRTPTSASSKMRRSAMTGHRTGFTPSRGPSKEDVAMFETAAPPLNLKTRSDMALPPRPRLPGSSRWGDAPPLPPVRPNVLGGTSLRAQLKNRQQRAAEQ